MSQSHDSQGERTGGGPSRAGEARWIAPIELGTAEWFIRSRRGLITLTVVALSLATCLTLASVAGWPALHARLDRLDWPYLAPAFLAHIGAYLGYMSAHHEVFNRSTERAIGWRRSAQITVIGFGAWLIGGGFGVDRRAHLQAGYAPQDAGAGVVVLGAMELMVLTPLAWVCALVLLHSRGLSPVVTVPWIVGVPLGLALAIGVMIVHHFWPGSPSRPWLARLSVLGTGLWTTLRLLGDHRRGPEAIAGIALYWAADIVALWAALQFASASLEIPRLVLGYATAYVFTRRTLPFAGTVVIELLLAVSLVWVGLPLAAAAIAVLLYRVSDFSLTLIGALVISRILDQKISFARRQQRA